MNRQIARNIHQVSGEQILLHAIFGSRSQRPQIRNESDTRTLKMNDLPQRNNPARHVAAA